MQRPKMHMIAQGKSTVVKVQSLVTLGGGQSIDLAASGQPNNLVPTLAALSLTAGQSTMLTLVVGKSVTAAGIEQPIHLGHIRRILISRILLHRIPIHRRLLVLPLPRLLRRRLERLVILDRVFDFHNSVFP